ncbi:MAG: HNH endonuclease [Acidobacteria bacterium]|nr:HNH endonuclease [Acidobacteriota bacterium]
MSYDMNRLRWVLTRRYYKLLQRLDARRLGTTAPAKDIINALVNRVLAEGLACHYCGVPLNLYAHAYDFKTALSLDHKVPLSSKPDSSAANLIICCVRCNFAKARTSYEEFTATVQRMRTEDRAEMNRYLDSLYEQRQSRPSCRTAQGPG